MKSLVVKDDGRFPNNGRLPLLLYEAAFGSGAGQDPGPASQSRGAARTQAPSLAAGEIEERFHRNGWGNSWRNGIYGVHHYHSVAHEALGVYSGRARVQFGGERGPVLEVRAGDAVVIPAGVAHKRLEASAEFGVVGAYPRGQSPDMRYGSEGERPETDGNIARVPRPESDPVSGREGPLLDLWKR